MKAAAQHEVSIALACRASQISETCYRYERKLSDANAEIAEWLVKLTTCQRRGKDRPFGHPQNRPLSTAEPLARRSPG